MTQFASTLYPQTNPSNGILLEFRRFCGPDDWDIASTDIGPYASSWVDLIDNESTTDGATWGNLAGLDARLFIHARRVPTRLANFTG